MSNVQPVDFCPICQAESDRCRVVSGQGYLITLKCTNCGCTWNTLNIHALPKKQQPKPKSKPKKKFTEQVRINFIPAVW